MTKLTCSEYDRAAHEAVLDGTGMYPLKSKVNLLSYVKAVGIPALLIHLCSSLVFYYVGIYLGLKDIGLAAMSLIPALLIPLGFVLGLRRAELAELGYHYFSRYEQGRRLLINGIITFGASLGFIFYVVFRWQLLPLLGAMLLLGVGLFVGNMVLTWMTYELASYILFGVLTWLVSVVSFSAFDALVLATAIGPWRYSWIISQIASFIAAVLFAFITNRLFVFSEKGNAFSELLRFFAARIFSFIVCELLTSYVMVNLLQQDREIAKFVGSFIVTIVNYFLSKYLVFTGKKA